MLRATASTQAVLCLSSTLTQVACTANISTQPLLCLPLMLTLLHILCPCMVTPAPRSFSLQNISACLPIPLCSALHYQTNSNIPAQTHSLPPTPLLFGERKPSLTYKPHPRPTVTQRRRKKDHWFNPEENSQAHDTPHPYQSHVQVKSSSWSRVLRGYTCSSFSSHSILQGGDTDAERAAVEPSSSLRSVCASAPPTRRGGGRSQARERCRGLILGYNCRDIYTFS